MKIIVGSDHRGFQAKEQVKATLEQLGHEYSDIGIHKEDPVDYPDIAFRAASAVSRGEADRAILACSTGLGMSIAANKVNGVRAALCHDEITARVSRRHNHSNVLCLAGDQVSGSLLRKIVEVWLNTLPDSGRHKRRVKKIIAIEDGHDPGKLKKGATRSYKLNSRGS